MSRQNPQDSVLRTYHTQAMKAKAKAAQLAKEYSFGG
jgi:hypothetical protein